MSKRTRLALLARGITSSSADAAINKGLTLTAMRKMSRADLNGLGIQDWEIARLHEGAREPVPEQTVQSLLFKSRSTCSVCRSNSESIVLHHIVPYALTANNDEENLIVVCANCHDKAHTSKELTRGLTSKDLLMLKREWEKAVRELDAKLIWRLAHKGGTNYIYFNHQRVFEARKGCPASKFINVAQLTGLVDANGIPDFSSLEAKDYAYHHGGCIPVSLYVQDIFENVIADGVINLSDAMREEYFSRLVRQGDLIAVEGKHYFKSLSRRNTGKNQLTEGRRKLGKVEVGFVFDRWEATSSSAWGLWLRGSPSVCSIGQVKNIDITPDRIKIDMTVLAIAQGFGELRSKRESVFDSAYSDTPSLWN